MTDAEIYEASGWCRGEDGYHGFVNGIEYAAQRARQQAALTPIMQRPEAVYALRNFADSLEIGQGEDQA